MTQREERPDAGSLLALSPNCSDWLLFSILFVCTDTTWQKFFPIELFREKPQDWEQKTEENPFWWPDILFLYCKERKIPFYSSTVFIIL